MRGSTPAPSLDSTTLLQLAAPETRRAGARAFAESVGADDMLLFLRDEEVGLLLPAHGLTQTLPGGMEWRALLATCIRDGEAAASLKQEDGRAEVAAWALACSNDVVVVLIGGAPDRSRVRSLAPLLHLVSLAVLGEHATAIAETNARLAQESASHAEALAKSLDRALRQAESARTQADTANRAKSDFLAAMSHELRTPLNAIGGYAQLMEMELRGPLTEEQRADLVRIRRSQEHLLGLINSILNFARIDGGHLEYELEDVLLAPTLEQVVSLIEPQARAKELRLTLGECAVPLSVRADAEKVRQIVLNLLANAVKFTDPHGEITITCDAARANEVAVSVADTGIGVEPDQYESIFDPFVQLGRRLTSTDEGVGLGLAISRDLARGMGGDLTVESELEKGSIFTLMLPRA